MGLEKSIDGFMQFAYIVSMLHNLESRWLSHINLLSNRSWKKCIIHIKFVHCPFVAKSKNKDDFDC